MAKRFNLSKKDLFFLFLIFLLLACIIFLSVLLLQKKNDEPSYYDQKCDMFSLENVNFSHGQIVFIGDSITDGCALDNYYHNLPLAVYNRGIGGDSSVGVLERLDVSLFEIKPSKIVLLIGANDVNGRREKTDILQNYNDILQQISLNLPEAQVFCVSILPMNKTLLTYAPIDVDHSMAVVQELNPEIEKLATKYGYSFVDLFSDFADEDGYLKKELTPDGIHLNDKGYLKYSSHLLPLLQNER